MFKLKDGLAQFGGITRPSPGLIKRIFSISACYTKLTIPKRQSASRAKGLPNYIGAVLAVVAPMIAERPTACAARWK